jgi:putative ABC transport system permease protein
MTFWKMITRSLRFYWRTHLAVLLGVGISSAVLVGALVVGDSIRYTLRIFALSRLGKVQLALASPNRYFRTALADDLESALNTMRDSDWPGNVANLSKCLQEERMFDTVAAQVLQASGIAINSDGTARANSVQVVGVDERFWRLLDTGPDGTSARGTVNHRSSRIHLSRDEVVINQRLAARIGAYEGSDILLRMEKSSLLPRDAPMSIGENFSVALRVTVKAIAPDSGFGRFSLQASHVVPFNAFVSLTWLQGKLGLPGRVNMILIGGNSSLDVATANSVLQKHWNLADAGLELRELPEQGVLELRSNRVFLDPPVVAAAERAAPGVVGVLTYFVNELRLGDRATPYSAVAAVGKSDASPGSLAPSLLRSLVPSEMGDDEILINTWLAEDLRASAGDTLQLTYFVFGRMRKLEERSSSFRIRAVLPIEGAAGDPELMPVLPGLSEAENCRDWDPGLPIDLRKIRKKDEEYWDLYRGTPKAFITLEAGQRMWRNRFGDLTALRYPLQVGVREKIEAAIRSELDPASIGLFFQPVREQALMAASQSMDFGQLFLGLSFFLVIAALLLTGLLFVFGIEQRREEIGTLMAIGFQLHQVQRLLLFEGGMLALIGGILGAGGGMLYTKMVLYALSTIWRSAVRAGNLYYHAGLVTLITGTAAGICVALLTIWITSRRQVRRHASQLLAGELESRMHSAGIARSRFGLLTAAATGVAALTILGVVGVGRDVKAAGAFFGAGAFLLITCLALSHAFLSLLEQSSAMLRFTVRRMGLRNSARRWGRSLATIGLLACGSFLVIAVGANRHDPVRDAEKRESGTGGFALYGESTLPVLHDLNSRDGRRVYGLDADALEGVRFVPFRVIDGDDASCLNLNRPQKPRLLGVDPEYLEERGAFTFVKTIDSPLRREDTGQLEEASNLESITDDAWSLLEASDDNNTVNAIGDENTISWSVGKSVGDTLMYTDERGQTFYIKIAGAIANSILQGGLIISEDELIRHFPSESGYRMFLIDIPSGKNLKRQTSGTHVTIDVLRLTRDLTYALQDVGLDLTPTAERLADFNALQNTYLSIFQTLGGLALLLGSLGLGIVVLRNVMERRSELALLRAVGFRNRSLQWLILSEHWLLLLLGLACGVFAGLVAVLPVLRSPGADIPYVSLTFTLFAILVSGALWAWLAAKLALRGPLLTALRNE